MALAQGCPLQGSVRLQEATGAQPTISTELLRPLRRDTWSSPWASPCIHTPCASLALGLHAVGAMDQHHALAERWRGEAALLRRCGAGEAAATREDCAAQLEAYDREHALEVLTLSQASDESGYSLAHLQRLVAEGLIENAGTKGAPRVARQDLPRKPPRHEKPMPRTASGDPDLVGEVLASQGIVSGDV